MIKVALVVCVRTLMKKYGEETVLQGGWGESPAAMSLRHTESSLPDCHTVHKPLPYSMTIFSSFDVYIKQNRHRGKIVLLKIIIIH